MDEAIHIDLEATCSTAVCNYACTDISASLPGCPVGRLGDAHNNTAQKAITGSLMNATLTPQFTYNSLSSALYALCK